MIVTNGSIIPAAFGANPSLASSPASLVSPPSRKESSFHREEATYIQTRADAERRLHTDTRRHRKALDTDTRADAERRLTYRHAQRQTTPAGMHHQL